MAFPGELNINYYKGDTHEFKIYPQKTDNSIFYLNDYSNATFKIAEVRGTAGVANQITGSAIISTDGTHITCAITPENGAAMNSSITYEYDVQVYSQGAGTYDKILTLLTGSISVTDDVSQGIGSPNRAPATYRVIYNNTNATSGQVPTDTTEYVPNQNVVVANNGTLARLGYSFSGWSRSADGTGTVYTAGSTIPLINGDIRLYPKWTVQ